MTTLPTDTTEVENIIGEDSAANPRVIAYTQYVIHTAKEFLRLIFPRREKMLDPFIEEKSISMLYAPRGVGKTLLGLSIAYAISSGGELLGYKSPRPYKVFYLDGEMPASSMQDRLAAITKGFAEEPHEPDYFRILCGDLSETGLPNLGTREGQKEIDAMIGDAQFIVIDNISTIVRDGKENDAKSWLIVQDWALRQRRNGRSVMFIHHAGKGGGQRGTSKREDVLDTVIALRHPKDYSPDEGARFEVHFEKARGFFGKDAEPFEATYIVQNGVGVWKRSETNNDELTKVVECISSGMSIRKTASETGLTKAQVESLKKQAVKKGLLH